jgi:hypothetical protein
MSELIRTDLNARIDKELVTMYETLSGMIVTFAALHKMPLTTRASFGFPTTNLTAIDGVKLRINPGLESDEMLGNYASLLNAIHTELEKDAVAKDAAGYVPALTALLKQIDLSAVPAHKPPGKLTEQEARDAVISKPVLA